MYSAKVIMNRQCLDKRVMLREFVLHCLYEARNGFLALFSTLRTTALRCSKYDILIALPKLSWRTMIVIRTSDHPAVYLQDKMLIQWKVGGDVFNPTIGFDGSVGLPL